MVSAVILAAGRGERMGADGNKVYLPLAGAPVLSYSLTAFACVPAVQEIVIVVRVGEETTAARIAEGLGISARIVTGGERRQDSARAGVEAVEGELVLIHDAARPFPSPRLITRVVECTAQHGACVPVIPTTDTMRYSDPDGFLRPEQVPRSGLMRMQTPQGFRRELIVAALAGTRETVTDDAGAVLAAGGKVAVVPGEVTNIKLTTEADLRLGDALLGAGLVAHGKDNG